MIAGFDDLGPLCFDEAAVPEYVLPDLFDGAGARRVEAVAEWTAWRRPELIETFRTHVYGRAPVRDVELSIEQLESDMDALDGAARRVQLRADLRAAARSLPLHLLVYVPRHASGPVPLFLGLNFYGNHTVHADPAIRVSTARNPEGGEWPRGARASYWAVEQAAARGYAVATVHCADFDDGFQNGAHGLLDPPGERAPDAWGAIGAWAWGLSRTLDALAFVPEVDTTRVAVMGHSRLGKTALWAGAQDPRFALVISNNSGCGGAALFRRRFGETVRAITARFPHWFCRNFDAYADRDDALPVDQHQLLALVAPRPLYVASASHDLWADPRGEFLAAREASNVWALYGRGGLALEAFPAPGAGNGAGDVGYHLREGEHAVSAEDWARFFDFADRHLMSRD